MSRSRRLLGAGALACALSACGGGFVEPHPPVLSLIEVQRSIPIQLEPVVYQAVLDLHVPDDPEACQAASARLANVLDASSEPLLQNSTKLPVVNLAPWCTQISSRTFSPQMVRAQMEEALAAKPGFHVRPLVLYANGSEVPLSRELLNQFSELVKPLSNGMRPMFWIVASKAVAHQMTADREIEWTFSTDDVLMTSITALAEAELPLWSTPSDPAPFEPLLPPESAAAARALKICSADHLDIDGVPLDGIPADLDPSNPPMARVATPTFVAQPASAPPPTIARAVVEICLDRCDRYVPDEDGRLGESWRATAGCALTGSTP